MSDLIHKTKIVPFINTETKENPVWTQIKKSTSFTLSTNPQTKTFDFISSEQPEEEIDSYQPSLAQELTMFKGEEDYQHIFDMLYELPKGEDAHRDVLIVFYQESLTYESESVFKAWKVDSLVKINQMDTVNESIGFDLSFNQIARGIVKKQDGSLIFVEGTFSGNEFTPKN